jgi:non-lysosomal glucosylceramidase
MISGKGVKEWPLPGVLGSVQEEGVWPGINYFVASTYVAAGKRFRRKILVDDGIQMGSAVSAQVWLNQKNGYTFNTPMSWDRTDPTWYIYPAYERELSIWDLMDSIKPLEIAVDITRNRSSGKVNSLPSSSHG